MESGNLKKWIFACVFGLFTWQSAEAKTELPEILGKWQFHKMIYKGQLQDPINPKLIMTFEFTETGLSELNYHRLDEQGFCERMALYYYDPRNKMLYQRVTWLHPSNRSDCSQDQDMQMNTESWSPVRVENDQLYLNVPLSDEEITLVWRRIKE